MKYIENIMLFLKQIGIKEIPYSKIEQIEDKPPSKFFEIEILERGNNQKIKELIRNGWVKHGKVDHSNFRKHRYYYVILRYYVDN